MKRMAVAFGLLGFYLVILSPCHLVSAAAPPEVYDVEISYRINAFRNQRLFQYYEMMRFLKKAGFQRDPEEVVPENEPEDVNSTRLRGTIPARRARDLLNERHIKSILLIPHGTKPPEDKTQLVRVDLELYSGLSPEGQRQLSEQTSQVLAGIQFRGAVGYDHRGDTRLVGSMPYNRLETLLTDLRAQPAGQRQPRPFQGVWAVRVAEVFPGMPLPVPRPRPPQVPKGQEKLSPDLRDVLSDAARAAKPMRLEVILAATPAPEDRGYRTLLSRAAPGLIVEGRLGPLVTVVANPSQAPSLAALPDVTGVRLPRLPQPTRPSAAADNARWQPLLKASGAARLQALGQRGRGIQLAVVDSDFRGWEGFVGKGLPPDTRLLDLTRERNADMLPDPFPAGQGQGSGTRHALTIARLAPEISLTLIRIDAAAPYMVEAVARTINGDPVRSISLDSRLNQLDGEQGLLDKRRDELLAERREVLQDFRQEGEALTRRKAYFDKQKVYDQDAARFHATLQRYLQFKRDLATLRGIRIVASALSWHDGFPVDGTSALSRYFDDRPFRAALWFQAAGDTRGQSWTGLFHDADNNGVMEFTAPEQPLPADLWSPELNFLSWRTPTGKAARDIPAGTRLRITLQWREAHDPLYAQTGEDPYRLPLARNLRVLLLHQADPTGKLQPADDLEIVAQSVGLPQRLDAAPGSAIYELTLEVQVKKAGRYAVRIEGRAPESIYPANDPTLPAMRRQGEMRLRLFVTPLDATGRAVLHDYVTANGSVGMPGDARTAITVGAADERNRRQPYSAGGAPFNMELLAKPDVLAYDRSEGTAEAAAFAAGLAVLAPSANRSLTARLQGLCVPPGGVLRLPDVSPNR
ncbi:MAG TPA: S8 family serine peptidase [Gemmataceae bacterium]|nr:S8 family serine peptidase [Gemmataceae bacterium]